MRTTVLLNILLCLPTLADAANRPNILLLLVDDLKPAMGCYGDTAAKTPNLDALAARGMRFDLAYCNQAVCAPSRFTLMLGSHSTSTGLYGLGSHLRQAIPNAVTMPQFFAQHGYRTESLGKVFHVGHGNNGDPDSFSVPHFKDLVIEYLDPASTDGGKLTREEALFTNQRLNEIKSLPRGAAFEAPDAKDEDYADGRVANETIRRLEAAKKRRAKEGIPFFITAGFVRPHLPFSAPKKYWDLHDPAKLPQPQYEEFPADSPAVAGKHGGEITAYKPVPVQGEIGEALKRELIHGYYASTSFVDAQIGKVLNAVNRLGLADDTIIVLWGDHGFHLGDLGIWTKHTNYEQANRIPILIVAPGVTRPGSATKQLAESVDIYPTLAELAGLPKPKGPQSIDGVSLVPTLKEASTRVRGHAFHAYPKGKLGRAIRTERYRLVEWRNPDEPVTAAQYELYDYQTDPLETRNHAAARPEIVERLAQTLATYPKAKNRSRKKRSKNKKSAAVIDTPVIAKKTLKIVAEIDAKTAVPNGVVLAQGGREHGYALHFIAGRAIFDVRVNGKVTRIAGKKQLQRTVRLEAALDREHMKLMVNDEVVGSIPSPGLIPVQPKDDLSVGLDSESAAGNYTAPNPFNGTITLTRVDAIR
jgi:iduronate 2-sulfatase